jgi:hypothetical protein
MTIDMRALKVGQKLYVHDYSRVYEATVGEMGESSFGWGHDLVEKCVHIEVANWDGSYNGHARGYAIDFDYDGSAICFWNACDVWNPVSRPDPKIFLKEPSRIDGAEAVRLTESDGQAPVEKPPAEF